MDYRAKENPADLTGMSVAEAKEYIAHHYITLKLTEKKRQELAEESAKWASRIQLARAKGAEDLALEAEKETANLKAQSDRLDAELEELKAQISRMRDQLRVLGSRERTVDPDLLEQELIIAAGYMPGEEEKAAADRRFRELEQEAAADEALQALKAKMGLTR
ncbi:MAG: chromosome partitioning protein [Spirochaetaceae bacterium]|jgi:phage shock protein A|nr:chromosome partitioning protein [Spirochaetaceae bacterium]